jgi:hypothetical protein
MGNKVFNIEILGQRILGVSANWTRTIPQVRKYALAT